MTTKYNLIGRLLYALIRYFDNSVVNYFLWHLVVPAFEAIARIWYQSRIILKAYIFQVAYGKGVNFGHHRHPAHGNDRISHALSQFNATTWNFGESLILTFPPCWSTPLSVPLPVRSKVPFPLWTCIPILWPIPSWPYLSVHSDRGQESKNS